MKITDMFVTNYSKGRPYGIDGICIHHMAGVLTARTCQNVLQSRGVSAHYGIGSDGEVARYVDEGNRAWASGDGVGVNSRGNDRAIHIENSNSQIGGNYPISDQTFDLLVELCYDIAKRNNLLPLKVGGNLFAHRDVYATNCCGDYLYGKLGELADRVNAMSGDVPAPEPAPSPEPSVAGLPEKGYLELGDVYPIVGRIASFMRRTFPAYTPAAALGNIYGPYIQGSIKEFQRRAKDAGRYDDNVDGLTGPKTIKALISYGFGG